MSLHQATVPAVFQELRSPSTSKGTSLSTTSAYVTFVPGTNYVSMTPYTFSTAVVARLSLMPYLVVLRSIDGLVTEPTDLSYLLQDGDNTATAILNSFPTLANGGGIYIGCHVPFASVYVDVQNTNSTANTMTAVYWNGARSSLTITDNTDSGPSLGQDGTVTWTVPTDWLAESFKNAFSPGFMQSPAFLGGQQSAVYTDKLYWIRLDFSVALDSSTSLNRILGVGRSSAYAEFVTGQTWEQGVVTGPGGLSGVEALTDAGSALLIVNCATYGKFGSVAAGSL